ncbi:MAG: UDP-glucose/GDP-mannose dehydrogenase family protein [Verrucomicrobia bacterium]|nr:UDP-glucose/GDP-mannose dehydrogenase family protein [Verrucomicrobiota bacterium]
MKISIVGIGYVGLVSGVCLASKGHEIICVDVSQEKVDRVNRGEPPIYEEGLGELLAKVIGESLTASTEIRSSVQNTDLSIIAVGTPFDGDQIDLTYIRQVARQIGESLKEKNGYHTVVVKSTVVPGTTEDVVLPLLEEYSGKRAGNDFGVGMNPEFLKEGEAIADFLNPDRIVLGGIDDKTLQQLEEVYAIFPDTDKFRTNPRTAEMIKYTANALLATLISFSNEMGNLSASIGDVDIVDVMKGVHLDKRFSPILEDAGRISPSFLTYLAAGCGFGGSCFPKDVKALARFGKDHHQTMSILDAVIATNHAQPQRLVSILRSYFPKLEGLKVAVLGLAFKPGTDDIRESASISVIRALIDEKASVTAFDPIAQEEAEKELGEDAIAYTDSLAECIENVDAVLLLTSWPEFKDLPKLINALPQAPLLIDGRRMLSKDSVERYAGIGLS